MSEPIKPTEVPAYTRMTAEVYDLIYSEKDYAGEAAKLKAIIQERCESGGNELLEAACGTGAYMRELSDTYTVEGFDLSSEQVAEANRRLPEARIVVADMTDFEMGKQYDVVTCLFSSIGYLQTKEKLDKAVMAMAHHTKPGGLVIVEPWITREVFAPGHIKVEARTNDTLSVARLILSTLEDDLSKLSIHIMAGTSSGIEHFTETHKLAMYSDDDFRDAFGKAGLEVDIDPEGLIGRRLCIGKKPL